MILTQTVDNEQYIKVRDVVRFIEIRSMQYREYAVMAQHDGDFERNMDICETLLNTARELETEVRG